MSFLKCVQNGKVKHPSQIGFKIKSWEDMYKQNRVDENDDRIYSAGLSYFKKFEMIRNQLISIPDLKLTKEKLIRLYIGLVNREMKISSKNAIENLKSMSPDKAVNISSIIEARINTTLPGHQISSNRAIEGMVSALRFPLGEFINRYDHLNLKKPNDKADAKKFVKKAIKKINMAILYHSNLIFWQESLWHGWEFTTNNEVDYGVAPATEKQLAAAVGEHRFQAITLEFYHHSSNLWKKIPKQIIDEICEVNGIISIVNNRGSKNLITGKLDLSSPSFGWVNSLGVQEAYMEKLSRENLTILGNTSVKEFLRVYEHLFHLGQAVSNYIPDDFITASPPQVLEFAPYFEYAAVARLIQQLTSIEIDKIYRILETLSFTGDVKQDIWLRPLIKINSSEFTPVLPALMFPNLIRSVEYWFQLANIKIDEKGDEFEDHVRKRINVCKGESSILCKSKVIENAVKFDVENESEEIDFIWILGKKIIVGEIKCVSHPAEPIEWKNLFDIVEKAKVQIKRKCNFILKHINVFLNKFYSDSEMEPSEFILLPTIILSKPMMSGFVIEDIPITDLLLLERYCHGQYERVQIKGEEEIEKVFPFFNSWEEAVNRIDDYLKKPPIIEDYKARLMLEETFFPPLFTGDRKFITKTFKISP